jgi:hypothetical protein
MLADDGNIDEGFEEAPWPQHLSEGPVKPAGYPSEPGTFSPPEWVYRLGVAVDGPTEAALDWHQAHHTFMILPMIRYVSAESAYIEFVGVFILIDYEVMEDQLQSVTLAYLGEREQYCS